MIFCSSLLLLSLMNLLIHRSEQCLDNPVFTPPSLVVKHGDSASAICSVCKKDCLDTELGLEKAVGTNKRNGTDIIWEVESLTEWGTSLLCYYNHKDGRQCSKGLSITLYQPPDNVSIGFVHGDRPLLAGQGYTLRCTVQNVAPVKHLIVTFYRGSEALAQRNFNSSQEQKPVIQRSTFSFNAIEEDDGAHYWCDARLDLNVQQAPPTVSSQQIDTIVHYKPRLISPSDPAVITITTGSRLELNCSAVGQPAPSYAWTHPSDAASSTNTSIYSIKSVTSVDKGLYTCNVSNSMGTVAVNFTVHVQGNNIGLFWIAIVLGVIFVICITGLLLYKLYHKHNFTGHFNLMKFNRNYKATPTAPTSA